MNKYIEMGRHAFNLNNLSHYRTHLMGVAALMIIICHAPASGVLMPWWLRRIFGFGNFGVDIFLFLSGLGCSYSLAKLNVGNLALGGAIAWYKRRLYRVFVPYLIIYFPYCLLFYLLGKYTVCDCLLCLSTLEYWFFHRGAWFISLIIVLYMLSPLMFCMLSGKRKYLMAIILIVLLTVLSNLQIVEPDNKSVLYNIQSAFSRVPCFILGLTVAQDCKDKKAIPIQWLILLAIVGIFIRISLDISSGLEWTLVPLLLCIINVVVKILGNIRWIDRFLKFTGGISLESYLTNITINSAFRAIIPTYITSALFYGRYIEYAVVAIGGLLIAYVVNRLVKLN